MNLRYRESRLLIGIGILFASLLPSGAEAAIVSCAGFDSGGNSCEVCAVDRSYLGRDFAAWDWFHNNIPGNPEVVFSGMQSNAYVDTMGNLATNQNGRTTLTKPVSHYMPSGYLNPVGQPDIVAFLLDGLRFTNHPASRDHIAARIVYDLRYGVPSIDGATMPVTINWGYTEGVESVVGGFPHLSSTAVYSGVSTKNVIVSRSHRECHNLYVSWCGDGVLDAGETCDAGTQNGVPGSGCSATCDTVSAGLCVPGSTTGAQGSPVSAATPGLCATGPVTNFSASGPDASGNISYAWGCNGSAVGGACVASYNSTASACVPGPTTGVQPNIVESTTAGLCASGAAQGFVAHYDPATRTVSYSWGCAGSAVGGACTASYVFTVGGSCLPGPTTGTQPSPIDASNAGLCRFGSAESFTETYNPATRTASYSWGCNGSVVGGACVADYTPGVNAPCLPGPTVGPQPSPIDASNAGLCRFGSAENFTALPDGSGGVNYSWGCAASLVGGACIASYNSSVPPSSCVPGPTTGSQPNPLDASTSGLCPVGVSVNNFTAVPDGSGNINYSWGCNGSAVGGACTATHNTTVPPGSSCQPGGVSANVGSPLTASSPGLCAAGPGAVHDFAATTPDSSGNVYYTWACGSSMAGGLCASHYVSISGGSSCLPGFTVGNVSGAINASTPGLCAAGPGAVHDFAATAPDSSGNVYYTWACGSSMAGGLCAANRSTSGGGWPTGGGGGYCGDGYLNIGESCEPYRWSIVGGVSTLVPNTASPNCRSDCTYCGDATLQPSHGEECDSALPGCNASCTLSTFTNPGQYPGDLNMTNPGGGVSKLADFRVIVGHGVSVFSDGTSITFDRSYPFYIDGASGRQVCLRDSDSAIKSDNVAYCKPIAMASPSTSLTLFTGSEPGVKQFVGNTDAIATGGYEDTSNSSFFVELGYLQEPVKTRVAKGAVANTAGGGGYLERSAGYDVGYLNFDPAGASASRFISGIQSGNFTTVSLRAGDLGTEKNLSSLSYAAAADASAKANIDSGAASGGDSLSRSARTATVSSVPSGTTISSESDFDVLLPAFRDQSDIRVQKYGDLALGSLHLTGVRTIIVEDGDLRITGNIDHSAAASYAFVVKNGNVVIDSSVTSISGIFIVSNGSLLGTARTTERLRIDGSVYGNIEPLLDTRTYIRGEADYEALSVGVIVNYSTRILTNPPPLVKEFVERFSLDRVAK